jgi:hypothetical protein
MALRARARVAEIAEGQTNWRLAGQVKGLLVEIRGRPMTSVGLVP